MPEDVVAPSAAPADDHTTPRHRRTLLVATTGTFLAFCLFTTPFSSLGSLTPALSAGVSAQTWILSSMSVGLTAGLLITGSLADDYGRRRMFLLGAVAIVVACLLGVITTSALLFILARIGQGLGAAALVSCSLGLIGHAFPSGPQRIRAAGLWGASVGTGIAFGPPFAALLDSSLGWRWPYVLLAMLAIMVAMAARLLLAESHSEQPHRVDVLGTLLLGVGTSTFLTGLVTGRNGWAQPGTLVLLAVSALSLATFLLVEWWTQRRGDTPLLELALLHRPDFAAVTVAALATGLGIIAAMSYAPIVIERGLHSSALVASTGLVIWSGISVPIALLTRRLAIDEDTQLAAGLIAASVGLVMLTGLHPGDGFTRLVPGLVIAGIGSGVLNAALGHQAVASVPASRAGMGSGANNTARYLGSAIGVTVVSVMATHADPAALLAGWNSAVLLTATFSMLGAGTVLALRWHQ